MIELIGAGLVLAVAVIAVATRKRRRMQRHPAPTFVFADLVGYTAMTDERGDAGAAGLAREFRRMMSALSREHGATQVKSMGDGVMIWAPDGRSRSRHRPSSGWGRGRTCCPSGSACTPGQR